MQSVTHVITTIEMGGAEKQLLILTSAQVKSGRSVRVFFLKGKPELLSDFEKSGVVVSSLLANKSFIVQLVKFSRVIFNRNEIIHAHLPQAELLSALSRVGGKLVITRHNAEPFWPGKPPILSKILSKYVTNRADVVIAISNAVKNYLQRSGELGNRNSVQVVHYGFPGNIKRREQRSESLIFGTISRLTSQKDLPTLLKAFAKIATLNTGFKLFIVGDGELRNQLEDLAKNLEISKQIHWLGRTSQVEKFLESLDVFVLTSRYEGFGMVILEAISKSVPILAANNDAITEVLGEDSPSLFSVGNYHDLAKKMNQMQKLDFKGIVLESNLARFENFGVSKMITVMDKIYSAPSYRP